MTNLLSDHDVIDRIFDHIDNKTTDLGDTVWREPVENYQSQERFDAEINLLRRIPVPFCPSDAISENGSYIARTAAGTPLIVVRGEDGIVRAYLNACRHRGMQVAKDSGCTRAFVCPYHAWTYGLDGHLKHIPGEDGFPDLDPADHGLVEVSAAEFGGIVYVNQKGPITEEDFDGLPEFFGADQQYFDHGEFNDPCNWKLAAETSMEGYHIKALHNKSFYPYGLDNINVVETFGPNSRVTFPFRRINKLRDIPREERRINGMVTSVYQLFPNTHISILSSHSLLIIMEPISPSEVKWVFYRVTNGDNNGVKSSIEDAKKDASFVTDSGLSEDRDAAMSIQRSMDTNANTHFTFGKFEKGIVHFHTNLKRHLQG